MATSSEQSHRTKARVTLLGMPDQHFFVQAFANGVYTLRGVKGQPTISGAADQVLAVPKASPRGEAAAERLADALTKEKSGRTTAP